MTDATEHPTDDITATLEALLANTRDPQVFARQLFNLNYTRTKATDPVLAELLRACAIPRAFNAEIIGVLRDQREDVATNARLLAGLLTFSFVLSVQEAGDYTYHDNTRQLLWAEWQQPEHSAQFEQYKTRLVAYYRT